MMVLERGTVNNATCKDLFEKLETKCYIPYKIAWSCIAQRLKLVLPKFRQKDQKGFLKGRIIGENIRPLFSVQASIMYMTVTGYAAGADCITVAQVKKKTEENPGFLAGVYTLWLMTGKGGDQFNSVEWSFCQEVVN